MQNRAFEASAVQNNARGCSRQGAGHGWKEAKNNRKWRGRFDEVLSSGLVLAARMQNREDHQIGIGKEPLFSFCAGGFGRANELSEVLIMGEGVEMVEADPGEPGYFILGEKLLAGLDSNHPAASLLL
jgi:hypothetical protein